MIAVAAVMVTGLACVLAIASSKITYGAMSAAGTLTPEAWGYLPYVSKQEPATSTATATLVPTSTTTPTPTATFTSTPENTSTPPVTATNTPTNTPTATPTPTTVPSVAIYPNHSFYVDSIDYLHIVGEVQNNTSNNLRFVKIAANLFSSSSQLLATDFTYIYLDNLPAGDRTCFHLLVEEPAGWSHYEFEAPTYWTDGEPLPNLTIFNDSGAFDPTFGWYEIIGQVRNDHGTRVEYVSPVGTLYNVHGTVIGCDFTFVNSTHLEPNQTSSFEAIFSGRDYPDVAAYRLQVDGNPQ